jgi:hypothetical protein
VMNEPRGMTTELSPRMEASWEPEGMPLDHFAALVHWPLPCNHAVSFACCAGRTHDEMKKRAIGRRKICLAVIRRIVSDRPRMGQGRLNCRRAGLRLLSMSAKSPSHSSTLADTREATTRQSSSHSRRWSSPLQANPPWSGRLESCVAQHIHCTLEAVRPEG